MNDKKLSSILYEDICLGMLVLSAIGNSGKVTAKWDRETINCRDNDNWVEITWNNGKVSTHPHFSYDKVTLHGDKDER